MRRQEFGRWGDVLLVAAKVIDARRRAALPVDIDEERKFDSPGPHDMRAN